MEGWTDEQKNGWTHGQTDQWSDIQMERKKECTVWLRFVEGTSLSINSHYHLIADPDITLLGVVHHSSG